MGSGHSAVGTSEADGEPLVEDEASVQSVVVPVDGLQATEEDATASVKTKLISLEEIDEIVSVYLGPISADNLGTLPDTVKGGHMSNQLHHTIPASGDTALLQSDSYYDETERRLYEVPRPSAPDNDPLMSVTFPWQRGNLLGSGAYGSVYLALKSDQGTLMAAKQVSLLDNDGGPIPESNQFVQTLIQEINVLRTLKHPNIVQYFGTQRDQEHLNIFLEFVPGGSIASILKRFGKFKETLVRVYTKQILLGLEYLHRHQIMHRDIKGGNILVDSDGICKLADFGAAARLADISQAQRRSIQGTPYWMAPEVIKQSGHGRQADIWSVGCTVIEMVTGKPPWYQFKTPVAALFHIASTDSPPELPKNISAHLKDFIITCMQRDPHRRPNATRLLQHPFLTNVDPFVYAGSDCAPVFAASDIDQLAVRSYLTQRYMSAFDSIHQTPFKENFVSMVNADKSIQSVESPAVPSTTTPQEVADRMEMMKAMRSLQTNLSMDKAQFGLVQNELTDGMTCHVDGRQHSISMTEMNVEQRQGNSTSSISM